MLPASVEPRLRNHIEDVRVRHQKDLKEGGGYVRLPGALSLKYPNSERAWGWQWVFPAHRQYVGPETGNKGGQNESLVNENIKIAFESFETH